MSRFVHLPRELLALLPVPALTAMAPGPTKRQEVDSAPDHAPPRPLRGFTVWTDLLADGPVPGFCGCRWDPCDRGDEKDTGCGIVGQPAMSIIRNGLANTGKAGRSGPWPLKRSRTRR